MIGGDDFVSVWTKSSKTIRQLNDHFMNKVIGDIIITLADSSEESDYSSTDTVSETDCC